MNIIRRHFLFPAIASLLITIMAIGGCGLKSITTSDTNPATNTSGSQVWELVNPKNEIARVTIAPFSSSGTFTETSDSPGWWVSDSTGQQLYRLHIGGTIEHFGNYDKWTLVGLAGSANGWQSTGNAQGITDKPFPNGTTISGNSSINTQSPTGKTGGLALWTGKRTK